MEKSFWRRKKFWVILIIVLLVLGVVISYAIHADQEKQVKILYARMEEASMPLLEHMEWYCERPEDWDTVQLFEDYTLFLQAKDMYERYCVTTIADHTECLDLGSAEDEQQYFLRKLMKEAIKQEHADPEARHAYLQEQGYTDGGLREIWGEYFELVDEEAPETAEAGEELLYWDMKLATHRFVADLDAFMLQDDEWDMDKLEQDMQAFKAARTAHEKGYKKAHPLSGTGEEPYRIRGGKMMQEGLENILKTLQEAPVLDSQWIRETDNEDRWEIIRGWWVHFEMIEDDPLRNA